MKKGEPKLPLRSGLYITGKAGRSINQNLINHDPKGQTS